MRILITGAKGMLGNDLVKAFAGEHELIGTDIDILDITSLPDCRKFMGQANPDIIINCAAYTLVDKCEEEVDLCYRVNSLGPRNLAIISNEQNIPLLHISTDYVFDGTKKTPYLEDDRKNALSVYGKSKSLAEDLIIMLTNKFYIIRTSWLFGDKGNNFIKTMLALGKTRKHLTVVNDQIGSPTYTRDLAFAIKELIKEPRYGIYHITNSENCSWYDFARFIFETAGYDVEVLPITTEEFNRPAPRPKYSVLENRIWLLEGFSPLRSYKEAAEEYIKEYLRKEV
jgi:dTDP-4-dehydrorhamnose reductase